MSNDNTTGCGCQGHIMPEATFSTFVLSLSSSAMVHLGEVPAPETGRIEENIQLAKHTIDILCMLKCKSRGNLEADEQRLLDDILYELRLKFVAKS